VETSPSITGRVSYTVKLKVAGDKKHTDDRMDLGALIQALDHHLRRDLLRLFLKRGEVSPVEASRFLKEPLANVSYHVRVLADTGALRASRTRERRGVFEYFYVPSEEVRKSDWVLGVLRPDQESAN
jgi:DNA-binding transcriptional ArsR family regulator